LGRSQALSVSIILRGFVGKYCMNEVDKQIQQIRESVARIEMQLAVVVERLGPGPGKTSLCIEHSKEIMSMRGNMNRWIGGLGVILFAAQIGTAIVIKLIWK